MGLLYYFIPASNSYSHLKSINIDRGWPTSFAGRERPGGDEFGCKGA